MTNTLFVSVLSDADLDAVTGGTGVRKARSTVTVSVSQSASGGFYDSLTFIGGRSVSNVGNTTNSSSVSVSSSAEA